MYYEYAVEHRDRKAVTIAACCLMAGGICFLAGTRTESFGWILETVSLCFFCATILFLSRYTLRNYLYRVSLPTAEDDWPAELAIVEIRGKRRRVVAQIRLAQIRELIWETPQNAAALRKQFRARKQFAYTVDFRPARTLCILCNDGSAASGYTDGDDLVLRLAEDETLTRYLERALAENTAKGYDPAGSADT